MRSKTRQRPAARPGTVNLRANFADLQSDRHTKSFVE